MKTETKRKRDEETKWSADRARTLSLRLSVSTSLSPAFTLVELMISIALVLLLMIGINQVFKTTGEAVGTGTAIATGIRDSRSAQSVLTEDLGAALPKGPFLIIRSERVSAFRNAADRSGDKDFNPADGDVAKERQKRTIDLNGDGLEGDVTVPGEVIPPGVYNDRSHRVDKLGFFARGLFRRQTGGGQAAGGAATDEYISSLTSPEAYVWYGHLSRPDISQLGSSVNANHPYDVHPPGYEPTGTERNPDNYYSTDWVLGRVVMLLRSANGINGGMPAIVDENGNFPNYIRRGAVGTLTPLTQASTSRYPDALTNNAWLLQWSRFDLAETTIDEYDDIILAYTGATPWWAELSNWRYEGDPRPSRPLTGASVARTAPVFIEHCTQFIVEFAGDFIEQSDGTGSTGNTDPAGFVADRNMNGTVTEPDGQIDFIVKNAGTANEIRTIRWYGFPRNVDVSDDTTGPFVRFTPGSNQANDLIDVVPIRDVVMAGGFPDPTMMTDWVERRLPPRLSPHYAHYQSGIQPLPLPSPPAGPGHLYVAAWGPDNTGFPRPKLIRIVFTIDDPLGRIAEGQTFEYVFKVGE